LANSDTPFGFKPVYYDPAYVREFNVDAGTATAIFRGDLAKQDTDGNASVMAAASDDFAGIVLSCHNSDGKEVNSLSASTAGKVRLITDPVAQYEVQCAGTLAATSIGDQADAIWTHAGSTNTGQAGVELSSSLAGDGNNAQFTILELVRRSDNAWGANVKVTVQASEHYLKAASAAI